MITSLRLITLATAAAVIALAMPARALAFGAGPPLDNPQGFTLDGEGHVVVVDSQQVGRIDPITGDREIISGPSTGAGLALGSPIEIAAASNGDLFLANFDLDALLRIDAPSGDRSIVSDATTGVGPGFDLPIGVAMEASGDVLVADYGLAAVVRVDPVTGDRTIVSDATTGSGPALVGPYKLVVETGGDLLVLDLAAQALIRVDATTGDRTIVADATTGAGPTIFNSSDLALETTGSVLLTSAGTVLRVDTGTGDRTVAWDPATIPWAPAPFLVEVESNGDLVMAASGSGRGFYRLQTSTGDLTVLSRALRPLSMVQGPGGDLFVDDPLNAVLRVDRVTGQPTPFTGMGRGTGPNPRPLALAFEASGNLAMLGFSALLRADPVTGDRTVISDASTGAGTPFVNLKGIAVEADGSLIVTDLSNGLYRVNPTTGDRVIISSPNYGIASGPGWTNPIRVAVAANGDIFVTDPGGASVIRVDPVTGNRSVASGAGVGSGPSIFGAYAITIAPSGDLLITAGDAVVWIDPLTGNRTLASSNAMGTGPEIYDAGGIVLDASGDIFVADRYEAILRIEPVTGDRVSVDFQCPAAPMPSCVTGFAQGRLKVVEKVPGKSRLTAHLSRGPAISQAALGDPTVVGGSGYSLCLYDDVDALAGSVLVERAGQECGNAPCWDDIGGTAPTGRGYNYKDKDASTQGVSKISLIGGNAGTSRLILKAGTKPGNNAALGSAGLPSGITAALSATSSVTMQVLVDDGTCFATTLTDIARQDSDLFKAR